MKTLITLIEKMIDNDTLVITEGTYMTTDRLMDLDGEVNGAKINIHLWFSIAPTLQSMLSRGGIVEVNVSLKVDGVSAEYYSHITPSVKSLIGSLIHKFQTSKTEKLEEQAREKLSAILA